VSAAKQAAPNAWLQKVINASTRDLLSIRPTRAGCR